MLETARVVQPNGIEICSPMMWKEDVGLLGEQPTCKGTNEGTTVRFVGYWLLPKGKYPIQFLPRFTRKLPSLPTFLHNCQIPSGMFYVLSYLKFVFAYF
jgi:hypothetical protein